MSDVFLETVKLAGVTAREAYQEGYRQGYNAGLKYAQEILAEFLKGLEPTPPMEQQP